MTAEYAPHPEWIDHVRRLVDDAPPLTPAQLGRLALLIQVAPKNVPRRKPENEAA